MKKRVKKVPQGSDLTPRQRRFVEAYLVCGSATRAAISAGYSVQTAGQLGYQLLQKTSIAEEVRKRSEEELGRIRAEGSVTLRRLKALAESNLKAVGTWDAEGNFKLKPSEELTEEEAYCIESIRVKQTEFGPETFVKMRSPVQALEILSRFQGILDEDAEKSGPSPELLRALQALDKEEASRNASNQESS